MLSKKFETLISSEQQEEISVKKDFEIEVRKDYVTVTTAPQSHSNMLQSKSFRVEKDVIVVISEMQDGLYAVDCNWLWRDPTNLEFLTKAQAEELKQVVEQIAQTKRSLNMQNSRLKGIRVGNQIWCDKNIDMDIGAECVLPAKNGNEIHSLGRLYSYDGVEQIEAMYKNWRVPTEEDFSELFEYLATNTWTELTKNMNFKLCGFHTKRLSSEEFDQFLEQDPSLRIYFGGFYWTSEILSKQEHSNRPKSRKYLYLNKLNAKLSFEESQCSNHNMLSLRLIKKN
jgi:uncharacterized protein (TIGR02145 family)